MITHILKGTKQEIASEIADGPQSVIEQQVEMGVAVRMAVMESLLVSQNQGPRA